MNHHRCYIKIPMNVFVIMNIVIVQRRRCYANISMNVSAILNVITTQQCGCYANIQMNVFVMVNVATTQRCKRCTFDSPGLASESEVYPGSFAVRGNNAVGVVPFIP